MNIRLINLLAIAMMCSSCKDGEIFEKEMYKNVVALISSEYHNTFQEVVPLTGSEVTGYLAASSGGTHATNKDLVIELEESKEPFDKYNWALFDADESLYAKLLSKDKYEISDYSITIKAGERIGRTVVKIRPEGLSPDSTYFIALKAKGSDALEINEKKNTILYQVLIANDYASQNKNDFYTMAGLSNNMVVAGNKRFFPLSKNTVRTIAGTETFENSLKHIENTSIIIEVNADNSLTIKPYKNLEMKQVNGNPRYTNHYYLEEAFGRKFHVFSLSYEYSIAKVTHYMEEELRLEIIN
ncbi:BT_3044 domain-containing protein [Sphingobacterium sp. HJSM2_6]|uniref:BT_3044 domain-containing protein n=1 Tax=Sphingobacterium sp. HJSM2_6 TaxID=3366264 RepID=UPI003BE1AF24